ncbi:MAG: tetratricopeptide repeat protein [Rhodospirillales bacterium]|nr:tetratricopeptide repeat protein [Rhodospirillales bacterium]
MGMRGLFCQGVRWTLVVLAAAAFALGMQSAAADWETGQSAYERGDIAAALEAWQPLAEAGDARAQAALGSLYIHGNGVAVDYAEALRWTRKAAEQGDVTGQFNMGTIYAGGLGVERDYGTAADWFARAAEQDDAASRFNLGVLYARGLGVPRDDEESLFLLGTATIIAGDPDANLQEIGAAAENYAYVVMMTMEEPALTRALERTRTWEKEFLRRYLARRLRPPEPKGNLEPLPFE